MNKSRIIIPLFALLLLTLHPVPQVDAWGATVHSKIAEKAINLLPEPYRSQFEKYISKIEDASTAPDQRKNRDSAEGPRHYDDEDVSHQDYNVSSSSSDYDLGVVAWAADNASRDLTMAMKQNDFNQIIRYLGDIAHYVSDAAQPFHATKNYDGQFTGNDGIHSRFETTLVINNGKDVFDLSNYSELFVVDDVYNLTEHQILSGLEVVPDILKADTTSVESTGTYNSDYYTSLYNLTRDILKDRIKLAIYHTACVWYTSIVASNWTEFIEPTPTSSNTLSDQTGDVSKTNPTNFIGFGIMICVMVAFSGIKLQRGRKQ